MFCVLTVAPTCVQGRDGHNGSDSAGGPLRERYPHPHARGHLLRRRTAAQPAPLHRGGPDRIPQPALPVRDDQSFGSVLRLQFD